MTSTNSKVNLQRDHQSKTVLLVPVAYYRNTKASCPVVLIAYAVSYIRTQIPANGYKLLQTPSSLVYWTYCNERTDRNDKWLQAYTHRSQCIPLRPNPILEKKSQALVKLECGGIISNSAMHRRSSCKRKKKHCHVVLAGHALANTKRNKLILFLGSRQRNSLQGNFSCCKEGLCMIGLSHLTVQK